MDPWHPPLSSHSTKTCTHQPTRMSREEQSRESHKIHIILACPWGAGSVHCARQESQALHNKPTEQPPPASSAPSKAHTECQPHATSSTGTWKQCPWSTSGGKGSTALQLCCQGTATWIFEVGDAPNPTSPSHPSKSLARAQALMWNCAAPTSASKWRKAIKTQKQCAVVPLKSQRT